MLWLKRRGIAQGSAFWGSHQQRTSHARVLLKKQKKSSAGIGILHYKRLTQKINISKGLTHPDM